MDVRRAARPAPGWFFQLAYRIGLTPWDGHALSPALTRLVEGPDALPVGAALDVGCGTGDSAVYLATYGWATTGIDLSAKALERARAKARAEHVWATFALADATRLSTEGIGTGFSLILDSGCLHGMSDEARAAYAGQLGAVAAPGAHLLILAFTPGGQFGVRGIVQEDVEQLFTPGWSLVAAADEDGMTIKREHPARHYLLQRREM
jgi:SAM-dependent methyltransferase